MTATMKRRFDKVYLEITNVCNLSCAFCALTERPARFMSVPEFTGALDRLHGLTPTLYFHLMGEPFLHPELPLFLDLAGERGFAVNITTNGTLLAARGAEIAGKAALARINLSVQSLEQFPEPERLSRLNALISSVKALVPLQRAARPGFLVSFRFWTRDDGTFSAPLLARLLEAFAPGESAQAVSRQILSGRNGFVLAPGVAIHAADTFEWPRLPQPETRAAGGTSRAEAAPLPDAQPADGNRPPAAGFGIVHPNLRGFCRGLRDQIGILADGTVVPCCLDRNGDMPLGNVFGENVGDILGRPRARALYDGFSARRVVEPLCANCTYRLRF